jgi:hypothetical protein
MVAEALFASDVAVTLTGPPAEMPVTRPVLDTDATAVFALAQLMERPDSVEPAASRTTTES